MRLLLCLNRVKMQTMAGGSLGWSKGSMLPLAHSCPYTPPTVVPTEVFVQLHDEKQQATDPAKEYNLLQRWGVGGSLILTQFCSNPACTGTSMSGQEAQSGTVSELQTELQPKVKILFILFPSRLFLLSAKSALRLLATLNEESWFSWGHTLVSYANQILPTAFLPVSQKKVFGMLFPAGDFS